LLQRQQEGSLGCAALRAASIGMTGYFAICVCPVLTGERNNDNREDPAVHRAREAVAAKESRAGCRVSRDRRQRDSRPGTIPCSPTEEPLVQSADASDRLADRSRCVRAKPLIPKAADASDATDTIRARLSAAARPGRWQPRAPVLRPQEGRSCGRSKPLISKGFDRTTAPTARFGTPIHFLPPRSPRPSRGRRSGTPARTTMALKVPTLLEGSSWPGARYSVALKLFVRSAARTADHYESHGVARSRQTSTAARAVVMSTSASPCLSASSCRMDVGTGVDPAPPPAAVEADGFVVDA